MLDIINTIGTVVADFLIVIGGATVIFLIWSVSRK